MLDLTVLVLKLVYVHVLHKCNLLYECSIFTGISYSKIA